MVNFGAENDASLYFFCLILHNEESQENENNIFFFQKKVSFVANGPFRARERRHNSGSGVITLDWF